MTYTSLELFMENLKQLIYSNDNPLINDHPSILSERPQLQLLYEELYSVIQILFHGEHAELHELKHIKYLKKRFKNTAEEAQHIIDLFVCGVHFRKKGYSPRPDVYKTSLILDHIMRSVKSIKEELIKTSMDNMEMDASQRTKGPQMQCAAAGTSNSRSSLGSKTFFDEIVVGLDHHVEVIRDKLVEDRKQLDVVSIVGMGGIGKTTLATKVFNDRFIMYHFDIRAWVTVSQTYNRRDVFIQILASLGVQVDIEKTTTTTNPIQPGQGMSDIEKRNREKMINDAKLREMLHKSLKGQRYLIVIDDIWSKEAWDDLKVLFPDDDTSSRILLTSRLNEVGLHAKPNPNGLVHFLSYLKEKQSWELLCTKVFHGKECPKWFIRHGIQIAEKCKGLPLAVVVIAGLLAKDPMNKDLWEKITHSVGSYIANDNIGHMETLALSYDHLPLHLRECFLYLGGFPENFKFPARQLMGLWVAEGFIHEAENQSLEDIAEAYLMELVDRNLLVVVERKSNNGVKAFKVHDLVRKLCLIKAEEERFGMEISNSKWKYEASYKMRHFFTNEDIQIANSAHPHTPNIHSLLCFKHPKYVIYDIVEYFHSFALLRVLDLQNCKLDSFPDGIALLIHLRYFAIWLLYGFPSSVCNLRSLQTLIVKTSHGFLVLPSNISDLVNLRHLSSNTEIYLSSIKKPMNLQTISRVHLGDLIGNFQKCFPVVKKLSSYFYSDKENDLGLLPYLETLKLTGFQKRKPELPKGEPNRVRFPATLKKLTLVNCLLPWSDMSIIQSLPNLEILKLCDHAFDGAEWNMDEEQFRQLKFLKLEKLDIEKWKGNRINFPCLKKLQLVNCVLLKEIPLEIGDIPTLELIKIDGWSRSIVESLEIIQDEQHYLGNYDLQISVDGMALSFFLSNNKDFASGREQSMVLQRPEQREQPHKPTIYKGLYRRGNYDNAPSAQGGNTF